MINDDDWSTTVQNTKYDDASRLLRHDTLILVFISAPAGHMLVLFLAAYVRVCLSVLAKTGKLLTGNTRVYSFDDCHGL